MSRQSTRIINGRQRFILAHWLPSTCGLALSLGMGGPAEAQQYTRLSVSSAGTQGNGASSGAVLSGDGKVVAFTSSASNLVAGDTNGVPDVFVRDLIAHTTTRVSVATDGTERTGSSGLGTPPATTLFHMAVGPQVSLSSDASIVAFSTSAAFDPNDTNSCPLPGGGTHNCSDIYVRDRSLNQTTRVSVASDGTQANSESGDPQVSADGRFVIFTSNASNLVPGDQNGVEDVFLHDRLTHTTTRVSVSSSGGDLNAPSYNGRISANGQIVAFVSDAAVVSDRDPLPCMTMPWSGKKYCARAFVLDRSTNTVTRIPIPPGIVAPAGATVLGVALTPDGRYVAINALHVQGFPGFQVQPFTILGVYDRQTRRVDVDLNDWGGYAPNVTINDSGRFVSVATSFTTPGGPVPVFDRLTFSMVRGHPDYNTLESSLQPFSLSADGLRILFSDNAAHVVDDTNGVDDVYIFNRDLDNDGMPDDWETQFGLNPNDPSGDCDGDGVTNLQEYLNGTHPCGVFKRYFAEGAANGFFSTMFAVFNPNDQPTTVVLEFLGSNGQFRSTTMVLGPHGVMPLSLGDTTGNQPDNDFSTVIEADRPIVADREMIWDRTAYGSHAETAIEAPATTWYLAEGSTSGAFDLFYLIQNPGAMTATVTVNYLRPAPAPPVSRILTIPPKTRRTIWVNLDPDLGATDVSAKITSDQPILVERAMYFSTPTQPFAAGLEGAAVAAPATSWFLAEGATGSFFDLYLLLANAETADADVNVTYLLPSGAPVIKHYRVPARSRVTINVNGEDPQLRDTPVSTVVQSANGVPVIAERAMWWPSPNWYEGHLSAGATMTGTKWALAAGLVSTTARFETETYILIANTSSTAGGADVTLYYNGLGPETRHVDLPANSRVNIQVSSVFPHAANIGDFAAIVQSNGVPIVVERAIYRNANGQTWAAGSDALATKLQ